MNGAPKGKIGRLPKAIQEPVNRRLESDEKGRTLVAWLNALPEVQAVLAMEFAGLRFGIKKKPQPAGVFGQGGWGIKRLIP